MLYFVCIFVLSATTRIGDKQETMMTPLIDHVYHIPRRQRYRLPDGIDKETAEALLGDRIRQDEALEELDAQRADNVATR